MRRTSVILLFGLLCRVGVCAGDSSSLARLDPVRPCAALVAAAEANRIPLEGIGPAAETNRLEPGDSISALITLFEKGKRRQWLAYLEVVAPNAKEREQKPAPPMVFYSSMGGTQKCVSVPAFANVRTLGPFFEPARRGKVPEKSERFVLNKGFLSLGLHHAAAVFLALEQGPIRGTWGVKQTPFTEPQIAEGRKLLAKLQITDEQERAMMISIPALLSYFEVVQNTPGLSDILFEVLDLPSAWSLLRNRGIKQAGIGFRKGVVKGRPALWGLPESAPVYHIPARVDLNGQPALKLTFVVTSPNPPLLACGGVVGLLAEKPDEPDKYLTLRVLSARSAAAK